MQDHTLQLGEALIHSQSGHLQVASDAYFRVGSRKPEKQRFTEPPDEIRARVATAPRTR